MTTIKLASGLLLAIVLAMSALGVWAFVRDPVFYGATSWSGGINRIAGGSVIPLLAACVAIFALRSLPRREP